MCSSTSRLAATSTPTLTLSFCTFITPPDFARYLLIGFDSLNVYAHALHELGKARANADDIFAGLREVYTRCKGGYACVAMITGFGILGFR